MVKKRSASLRRPATEPDRTTADVTEIVDASRRVAARSVNSVMIATYWAIGRRLAEQELREGERAPVPDEHLARIAAELTARFGRGYTVRSLRVMRAFYGAYHQVRPVMRVHDHPTRPRSYFEELNAVAGVFSLSWSHYVELVKIVDGNARRFYECEALRHDWTVRQLALQIRSGLFERVRPPRDLDAIRRAAAEAEAAAGMVRTPRDPDEALRDPYLRRFFDMPARGGASRARDGRFIWLPEPQIWLQ
jgi:hypothetical protein